MNPFLSWRLRRAAQRNFGWRTLRAGQLEAMRAILRRRDTLVVLPTGHGKSAVYQVPASVLAGPTVVISPLLALQHDQITSLNDRGVAVLRAVGLSSAQTARQQADAIARVRAGEARLLFVTPEQLAAPARLSEIASLKPALVAVDEAHCISTWGHDFRPDYLALAPAIRALGRPPVVALTATASPPVREDIIARLGLREPHVVIGGLDRPNLFLQAMHCPTEDHRWRRLLALLDAADGAGIVYVPTRRIAEDLAGRLAKAGHRADFYHGGMATGVRKQKHERFAAGDIPVMIATSAFGMGIDKADIRWIAHVGLPDSPDSYLQEIGRAGRDGEPAHALLLHRDEDIALHNFFTAATPAHDELLYLAAGVRAGVKTKTELGNRTGMGARKVASLLALLETAGAVTIGEKGGLSLPPYAPEPAEAATAAIAESERHRTLQRSRTDMMRRLAEGRECRVRPLLGYFGEQVHGGCGHCDNCVRGPEPGAKRPEAAAPRQRAAARRATVHPYPLHSAVRHREWGRGTVLGYDGERMTVLFEDVGYKTLSVAVVRDNGLLAADPA